MRLRCRIADDAPPEMSSVRLSIEIDDRRIGVQFVRSSGVRERAGPGCIVDLSDEEAGALRLAIDAHDRAAFLILDPIPEPATGPVLRLTVPGECRDRDIVEVPFIAFAPGASEAEVREADRRIERKLPALVRQVAVACGGVSHLSPFRTAEERAVVARRAPPPGVEHPLVGRARVLEEAARQIREKAAAEIQAAAISRHEIEMVRKSAPAFEEAAREMRAEAARANEPGV